MALANSLLKYFDLNSGLPSGPTARGGADAERQLHWLPQYVTLFVGVLIQPSFAAFRQSGTWVFDGLGPWSLFALISAFLIFPSIYRRTFDPEKPVLVLLAPIFTAGLGWESLVGTALKAATGGNGG